jgi:hypothetical protein
MAKVLQKKSRTRMNVGFFNKREMRELPSLLVPEERVLAVVGGWYTAGFAVLCVTTHRVLLVDKKLVRLNFEDIRFDSLHEVNYSQEAFSASLRLFIAGRNMHFKSWRRQSLREVAQLIQEKMFEVRRRSTAQGDSRQQRAQDDPGVGIQSAEPVYPSVRLQKAGPMLVLQRFEELLAARKRIDMRISAVKSGRQIVRFSLAR